MRRASTCVQKLQRLSGLTGAPAEGEVLTSVRASFAFASPSFGLEQPLAHAASIRPPLYHGCPSAASGPNATSSCFVNMRQLSTQASGEAPVPDAKGSGLTGAGVAESQGAQQQEPEKAQQRGSEGWGDEAEPPPVPLDPNVTPPGMLFVSTGALVSALLAVGIATLGIVGTFYAGYAISQVAKELKATAGGAGDAKGSTGPSAAGTPSGSKLAAVTGSSAEAAAVAGQSQPQAVAQPAEAVAASDEPRGSAATTGAPAVPAQVAASQDAAALAAEPPKRRSWWQWLRSIRWSRQKRAPGGEVEVAPAAPS